MNEKHLRQAAGILAILLGAVLLSSCQVQERNYHLTVQQRLVLPDGTEIRCDKQPAISLNAGKWEINVTGQSKDAHTQDVSPQTKADVSVIPK